MLTQGAKATYILKKWSLLGSKPVVCRVCKGGVNFYKNLDLIAWVAVDVWYERIGRAD